MWFGLGFTAVGWAVLVLAVWGDLHVLVAYGESGKPKWPRVPFGCLTLVGLASSLAGAVLLFVRGWPWGVGAVVVGLVWTQWLSGRVLAALGPELFARARELGGRGWPPEP